MRSAGPWKLEPPELVAFISRLNTPSGCVRDERPKAKIALRIDRPMLGNPGDIKPVGDGVTEMRIDDGPGYRVYYGSQGKTFVVILCGETKKGQSGDIKRAKSIFASWTKDR